MILPAGQPLHDLSDHTDVVRDLKFAPDGSMQLVSASRDGTLRVWRLDRNKGGKQHTSRILHGTESKWLYACCWSPNAHTLVAVGKNGSVSCGCV
jgi:WD repeat and SOCS box-containing protein 1